MWLTVLLYLHDCIRGAHPCNSKGLHPVITHTVISLNNIVSRYYAHRHQFEQHFITLVYGGLYGTPSVSNPIICIGLPN